MAHVSAIRLLWFLSLSSSLYSVCASSSADHLSFTLTHVDAESSPLRSAEADPANLPEDMPMRAFVAAGRALQARLNKKRKLMKGNPAVVSRLSYGGDIVGGFYLTVPVGTPSQNLIFLADTGSEFPNVQCSPCLNCTHTPAPRFTYSHSSSFNAIGCDSLLCRNSVGLAQIPGVCDNKSRPACQFGLRYGDGSTEVGFYSIDFFKLGPKFSQPFVFGCANLVHDTALTPSSGIMGLDAGPFSFTSQLFSSNPKMPKKFAYCLPDRLKSLNAPGRIEFGNYKRPANVRYTPLAPPYSPVGSVYYYVELQGITVGKSLIKVDMGAERVSGGGTIFDSGSALTSLVSPVYDKLVGELRGQTAHLKPFDASKTELESDLCYKVAAKAEEPPKVPRMSLHFARGVELELGPGSILYPGQIKGDNTSIYFCLAFQRASDNLQNIIGNQQQQDYWIDYNLEMASLGLAKAAKCA